MTKRSRGTRRPQSHRPGTRAPLPRAARAARPVSQLEAAEEIASEIVEEQPDEALEDPPAAVVAQRRTRPAVAGGLAVRAATEYLYVAQDLRRIVAVALVLFAIMLVLWVLIVVTRVIPI